MLDVDQDLTSSVQVKMQHHNVHSNEVVQKLREQSNVEITRLQVKLTHSEGWRGWRQN